MSARRIRRTRPRDAERVPAPLPPLPVDVRAAVVIPARDATDHLAAAVASVRGQDRVAQIVVAAGDAATARAAAGLAVDDPRLTVVSNPTGRTPDALNLAIAASDAPVVVRLDAHAVLPPGYVARAIDVLRASGAANVGGRQVPTAGSGFARAVAAAMRSPVGAGGAAYRTGTRAGPVDTVYLGVFRRDVLDAVGGFDPRFTRNQDAELNVRLREAGYRVWFDPELAVAYAPRGSLVSLARQYHAYGRWRRLTAELHPASLGARQLAAPVLVGGLAASAMLGVVVRSPLPPALAGGAYATLLAVAGVRAAPELSTAPATALALAAMHLSWGFGFLAGPPRDAARAVREASRTATTTRGPSR